MNHPPSTNAIPWSGVPSFCRKALCSECKKVKLETDGRWRSCGKGQQIFVCDTCRKGR